jgi:hypothetical protein
MRPLRNFSAVLATTLALLTASAAWGQSRNPELSYSTSVSVPFNYSGPICIRLGQWDGNASVLLETQKFYSETKIRNATRYMNQALLLNVNTSTGSMITVHSDRLLSPDLSKGLCQAASSSTKINSMNWRRR